MGICHTAWQATAGAGKMLLWSYQRIAGALYPDPFIWQTVAGKNHENRNNRNYRPGQ
jgi:hypothetical protein